MPNTADALLQDALADLIGEGRAARAAANEPGKSEADVAFEKGRSLAYYEVVSYLLQQIDAFGLQREKYGIDSAFSADNELL